MREYSDIEIVQALKDRNNHDVIKYLYTRYLPMIKLMSLKLGGTGEDAKDLFQEGIIIIMKKIDGGNFVLSCKFKTFLYVICENLWKMILSKRNSAKNYLIRNIDTQEVKDFTEDYDRQQNSNLFYEMFDKLDPSCKQVLRMYWQEYSPLEIAEKLGYSYGYVRKRKSDCQGRLIELVRKHPDYSLITN